MSQSGPTQPPPKPFTFEIVSPEEGFEYATALQVNCMCFTDGAGISHEVHIPAGRADEARALFVQERWDELCKFPRWENQPYTDDFYIITKYKAGGPYDDPEGKVVKKAGEPLVKTADGLVVLAPKSEEPKPVSK